ncbi:hypothetical protein B0A54_07662 [Friedmanniomyces endolithicus]|uniref:Uncharacterized protein n=1 Tax=Friedmanniomyces endolithicus TaxID=329885 RepID=A0A4U0UY53_9PEZI|nr:hypothetical protein B0A54_07662 [Friedmanniomyces endolithicus]
MADASKSPTPPAKSKRKASGDSDGSPTRKAKAPKLTANDYSNGNDRQLVALDAIGLGHPTLPIRDLDPKDNVPDEVEGGEGDVEMIDGRAPAHTGLSLYEEDSLPLHVMAAAQREIDAARKGNASR